MAICTMANFFKILAIMDLQIMTKKKTYAPPPRTNELGGPKFFDKNLYIFWGYQKVKRTAFLEAHLARRESQPAIQAHILGKVDGGRRGS